MVDLKEFDSLRAAQEDGIDVKILHPASGEELGITIRVAGPDSERLRKARAAVLTERMSRRAGKVTPQDMERDALAQLSAAVISWSGVVVDGREIECSRQNVAELFTRFPFIREQVDIAVGDRAGFMKS